MYKGESATFEDLQLTSIITDAEPISFTEDYLQNHVRPTKQKARNVPH